MNKKMAMIVLVVASLSAQVYASSPAAEVRKDINSMFFGGSEKNQRLVNQGSTCEVIITNDSEAKTTQLQVSAGSKATFIVDESDLDLVQNDDYDAKNGLISILTGPHQTSSLKISRYYSNLRKSFEVSISNGFGMPVSCEVF
jgi:hypothetical protein